MSLVPTSPTGWLGIPESEAADWRDEIEIIAVDDVTAVVRLGERAYLRADSMARTEGFSSIERFISNVAGRHGYRRVQIVVAADW